jgi:hypothetical protein
MPWWGWMLLGAGLVGAALVAVYIFLLRRPAAAVDRNALLDSERTRLEDERTAAERGRAEAERVARELEAELRGLVERRKKELEAIDAEKRKEYADLVGDPDALLERIDKILSGSGG